MAGPCSMPAGDKREWEKHNEIVCNIHKNCTPDNPVEGRDGEEVVHEFVTTRVWLMMRNRLYTGKTEA